MRKLTIASVVAAAGLLLALSGCTTTVSNHGPAPAHAYVWGHGQPRLVIIEGTGISYVADCGEDIYFLDGIWYRYYGGAWYHCRSHGGAWVVIGAPPPAFGRIPPGHAKFHKVEAKGPGHEAPPGRGPGSGGPPPGRGGGRGPKR